MEQPVLRPEAGVVLAKATARASQYLGINGVMLAETLGVSAPTVSRILNGKYAIDPASKEGELALLLVRVYRSLDALVGMDDGKRQLWMKGFNKALGGVPLQLVQKVDGLVRTLAYVDAMRAPT